MSEVKKVITAADRSTKALTTAATGLAKIATDLAALSESTVGLSTEIEYKQSELDNLSSQFDAKFRESSAELKLRVIEDEDKVLASLLKARGLITIVPAELTSLQNQLQIAERDIADELKAAAAEGKASAAIAFNAEKSNLVSEHRIAVAQHEANANSFKERIGFLTEQNESLKQQIADERTTRLEIAKADANRQGVVVNNSK